MYISVGASAHVGWAVVPQLELETLTEFMHTHVSLLSALYVAHKFVYVEFYSLSITLFSPQSKV